MIPSNEKVLKYLSNIDALWYKANNKPIAYFQVDEEHNMVGDASGVEGHYVSLKGDITGFSGNISGILGSLSLYKYCGISDFTSFKNDLLAQDIVLESIALLNADHHGTSKNVKIINVSVYFNLPPLNETEYVYLTIMATEPLTQSEIVEKIVKYRPENKVVPCK